MDKHFSDGSGAARRRPAFVVSACLLAVGVLLSGCASDRDVKAAAAPDAAHSSEHRTASSPHDRRVVLRWRSGAHPAVPGSQAAPDYREPEAVTPLFIGPPYKVAGRWYHPKEDKTYDARGLASWYGADFAGRRTASGEPFDPALATAAHPTLPLPVIVRVTNLRNGRSTLVRVNDRGPFTQGRIIDVSRKAAQDLGFLNQGTAPVRVEYVGRAPADRRIALGLSETVGEEPAQMADQGP